MTLLLDRGYWSAYSCADRLSASYLAVVAVLLLVCGFWWLFGMFRDSIADRPASTRNPVDKSVRRILIVSVVATVLILSLVAPLSRTRTELRIDAFTITETGCQLARPYTTVLERSQTRAVYVYRRGKTDFDGIEFRQKGRRVLSVTIDRSHNGQSLREIAPEAMAAYAEKVEND